MNRPVAARFLAGLTGGVLTALLVGCSPEPTASNADATLRIASAKATATYDMSVSAVSPDSATQDTTLDVVINGSGFVTGTTATWALSGVQDPTQVRTNSTRYVNSRQLVANITISASATIAKWDVVVTAASKKGGIGTEAFAIKAKPQVDIDSRANVVFSSSVNVAAPGAPVVMAAAGIQGDSRDKFGAPLAGSSEYQGAFCGVNAKIFWASGPGTSGDMVFDSDMDFGTHTTCGARRFLNFFLSYQSGGSTGTATQASTFSNVRAVMQMAPGEVISRKMFFNYSGIANCDRIAFDAVTYTGSSNIRVTRLSDLPSGRQWYVESEYPHMAMCTVPRGQDYAAKGLKYLPFAFTVTEIPYPYPSYP